MTARRRPRPACAPEARGRIERLFQTLQGRLPQDMRVAGIASVEEANRYIREVFLPAFNAQFAVMAAEEGSAFVPWGGGDLAEILCIQEERQVGRDNCVRYDGLSLQIPAQAHRHHFVKATVIVKKYPHGALAIFHGPRYLARYRADGSLPNSKKAAA